MIFYNLEFPRSKQTKTTKKWLFLKIEKRPKKFDFLIFYVKIVFFAQNYVDRLILGEHVTTEPIV